MSIFRIQKRVEIEAIMELSAYLSPRTTRKPSTLKKLAYEPEAKYINKQVAISLAKKLRLSKIGNVTLRITSKQKLGCDTRVTVKDSRPTTRRIIMDRSKGMMTAENTRSSAVGKCILGSNDYESRRFSRDADGIDEMKEQKRKYFLQKKRGFAQRQLLKLQEGECQTKSQFISSENQYLGEMRRKSDPHYMNLLKCEKKAPIDLDIVEITRLVAGNPDPRLQNVTGFDDTESNVFTLYKYRNKEQNEHAKNTNIRQRGPIKQFAETSERSPNVSLKYTARETLGHNGVPKIKVSNFVDTTIDDRLAFDDFVDAKSDLDVAQSPVSQCSTLAITPTNNRPTSNNRMKGHVNKTNHHGGFEPRGMLKNRPQSRTTKTIISQLKALKKTAEKKSKPRAPSRNTIMRERGAAEARSILDPAKDPRFTNLASSLVPDSAKSHVLYRSMGQLSLDNESLSSQVLKTTEKLQPLLNDNDSHRHN